MSFNFYNPDKISSMEINKLPSFKRDRRREAKNYLADKGLIDAVNIALLLNKPLLVTGKPGTGKTLLAYSVAYRLGMENEPFIFETKSTSTARDLFYTHDSLTRFLSSQNAFTNKNAINKSEGKEFIVFNALGKAILLTNDKKDVNHLLNSDFIHDGPYRSVVLIDEIDKAPRDFPNDLLNEIENMYFKIPELRNEKISATKDMFPIIIITSNSEKHLPDAFLRRCIYYNITFPDKQKLKEIVLRQIKPLENKSNKMLDNALDFFSFLRRDENNFTKKPSIAELLEWLTILNDRNNLISKSSNDNEDEFELIPSVLVKTAKDQTSVEQLYKDWLNSKSSDSAF